MKNSAKRLLAVVMCMVFVVVLLAACGAAPAPAATETKSDDNARTRTVNGHTVPKFEGDPSETYYMVVMVSGVEYWFPVYEMFKQCAWELGVKSVYTGTPEYDVNKEIAVFEQVLAKKPAGIFVHPMNADAFVQPIDKAIDSGVPVVTFAADSPNSKRRTYITSDNVYEAQVAAKELTAAIGDSGEIGVLENPGQSNHDLYIKSFIAAIEKDYPKFKIVGRAATNQDTAKAYQSTLAMIQGNPNLAGIVMPEGNSALGAAQAVKEKGGKVLVVTRDLNVKVLDMIKAGEIWGAINPDQGMQGYFGMLTLFVSKHTELVDPMSDFEVKKVNPVSLPFINNGMAVVTKENADCYYWDKYLKKRGTKGIEE